MNFVQSTITPQENATINLEKVSKISFSKKAGNNNPSICFEFEKGSYETWNYPDEESFNADIQLLESMLDMPGEKLTAKIVKADIQKPKDITGYFF